MATPRPTKLLAFLVPFPLFAALALAFVILGPRPLGIYAVVSGGLFAAILVWILISVLWPARAERRCPRCGGETLGRIDPNATIGVACSRCGFQDAERSAWLLAEEEGPLERIVLEERRRRGHRVAPGVDRPPVPD